MDWLVWRDVIIGQRECEWASHRLVRLSGGRYQPQGRVAHICELGRGRRATLQNEECCQRVSACLVDIPLREPFFLVNHTTALLSWWQAVSECLEAPSCVIFFEIQSSV